LTRENPYLFQAYDTQARLLHDTQAMLLWYPGNPVMAPGHGCYGTLQGCCGTCACAH